jgi:hypothetical protein
MVSGSLLARMVFSWFWMSCICVGVGSRSLSLSCVLWVGFGSAWGGLQQCIGPLLYSRQQVRLRRKSCV